MGSYSLSVDIDSKWHEQFNRLNYKLCMATSVNSSSLGTDSYNIVSATSKIISGNVTFQWTEEYAIAASHQSFSNGVKVTTSTKPVEPIMFGQLWTLPATWKVGKALTSSSAPFAGFLFVNEAVDANCVLYKRVNQELAPIYISAAGPLPPGTEELVPKIKVRIWFSSNIETGTMISSFATTPMTIDFTGTKSQSVGYDAGGVWNFVSSDYSVAALEKELGLLEAAHEAAGHRDGAGRKREQKTLAN